MPVIVLISLHLRYKLMLECWGELTNERPSFNEVEARLDAILQQVANRVILIHLYYVVSGAHFFIYDKSSVLEI